jgi:hypothetical protein
VRTCDNSLSDGNAFSIRPRDTVTRTHEIRFRVTDGDGKRFLAEVDFLSIELSATI